MLPAPNKCLGNTKLRWSVLAFLTKREIVSNQGGARNGQVEKDIIVVDHVGAS
jgi:hypothetical protein